MTVDKEFWSKLSEKLKSSNAKERFECIQELAGRQEIQAIRLLLRAIEDNSNQNRQLAGDLLLKSNHPAAPAGLIAMLDSEKFHVQITVKDLLRKANPEQVLPQIMKLLQDDQLDESIRLNLIPLFVVHGGESNSELALQLLESGSANSRAVIEGLCLHDSEWSNEQLVMLLQTQKSSVQEKIAATLSKRKGDHLVNLLVQQVADDSEAGEQATLILSRICDEQQLPLIEKLTHSQSLKVRLHGLKIIETISPEKSTDLAFKLESDPSEQISSWAISFLQTRAFENIHKKLADRLCKDPDDPVSQELLNHTIQKNNPETIIKMLQEPVFIPFMNSTKTSYLNQDLLDLLAEKFDSFKINIKKQILSILAQREALDSIKLLKNQAKDTSLFNNYISEAQIRTKLRENNIVHVNTSFEELIEKAKKAGWSSKHDLLSIIEQSKSLSGMAKQRGEWMEKIRHHQKEILKLEPVLNQRESELKNTETLASRQKLFAGLTGVGLLGSVICLYKNWQPVDHSYWYLGLIFSVILVAIGVFGFRSGLKKIGKKTPRQSRGASIETLRTRLQSHNADMNDLQKKLDQLESDSGGSANSDAKNSLKTFIQALK